MSQLIFAEQSAAPTTPSSGKVAQYVDNTGIPLLKHVDDAGTVITSLDDKLIRRAFSTGAVAAGYATDTYLQGSAITFPSGRPPVAGATYRLRFDMVKTAAGTATGVLVIRFGTLGTTGDAAILTFTFAAGTAAIDSGVFEVNAHFRTVGSGTTAVLTGIATCAHHLAATGLVSTGASGLGFLTVTSSGFDSTVANSIIGASFNGGASFSGTCTLVEAELRNLSA